MEKEELKVLGTWSSPFSRRVVWALQLKGLEYEYMEEDFSNKSPLLLESNPVYKKIPVLVHNGKPVAESLVILEYIDDTWRQNPLLPDDSFKRAMARFFVKFIDDKFIPSVWSTFLSKEPEEGLAVVKENLAILEEELKGKEFFGGESIGLVDISLGSIFNLIDVAQEITNLNMVVDGEKFPVLAAWKEKFLTSKIIVDALPSQAQLIIKYRRLRESLISESK